MTDIDKQKLKLALSIMSGRKDIYDLEDKECEILGFNPILKRMIFDGLTKEKVLSKVEEIIFDFIIKENKNV